MSISPDSQGPFLSLTRRGHVLHHISSCNNEAEIHRCRSQMSVNQTKTSEASQLSTKIAQRTQTFYFQSFCCHAFSTRQRTPCSSLGCHQGSFYRAFLRLRWGHGDGDAPVDDLTGLSSTSTMFFPLNHSRLCFH